MPLSTREKGLIAVLVLLLVGTGLYFGVGAARERLRELERRVATQEAMAQKAAALTREVQRLQQPPTRRRTPVTGSLIGYAEQLAARVGVKDRIQLNVLPRDTSRGLQGLDMRVDRLTLDELVNLLYTVENADYRLVIDQIEISPSFRDQALLRLSMRVLSRE